MYARRRSPSDEANAMLTKEAELGSMSFLWFEIPQWTVKTKRRACVALRYGACLRSIRMLAPPDLDFRRDCVLTERAAHSRCSGRD